MSEEIEARFQAQLEAHMSWERARIARLNELLALEPLPKLDEFGRDAGARTKQFDSVIRALDEQLPCETRYPQASWF